MLPLYHRRAGVSRRRIFHVTSIVALFALSTMSIYFVVKSVQDNNKLYKIVDALEQDMFKAMGNIDPYNQTWLDLMDKSSGLGAYDFKERTDQIYGLIYHSIHDQLEKMRDEEPEIPAEALAGLVKAQRRKLWLLNGIVTERQVARISKEKEGHKRLFDEL